MNVDSSDVTIHRLSHDVRVKIRNRLKHILTTYGIFKDDDFNDFFMNKKNHNMVIQNNVDAINFKSIDFHLLPYKYFHIFYFVNKLNLIVDYYNYIQRKWKTNYEKVEEYINSIIKDSYEYADIYECVFDYLYLLSNKNKDKVYSSYYTERKNFVEILNNKCYDKYYRYLSIRLQSYNILEQPKLMNLIEKNVNTKNSSELEKYKIDALKTCFNFILINNGNTPTGNTPPNMNYDAGVMLIFYTKTTDNTYKITKIEIPTTSETTLNVYPPNPHSGRGLV